MRSSPGKRQHRRSRCGAAICAELFGHQQIAGKFTSQVLGTACLLRVDVPETEAPDYKVNGKVLRKGCTKRAFTGFFGVGAVYSITPVGEEVARQAAVRISPAPVIPLELSQRALPTYDD